jgi:hypothetical protein
LCRGRNFVTSIEGYIGLCPVGARPGMFYLELISTRTPFNLANTYQNRGCNMGSPRLSCAYAVATPRLREVSSSKPVLRPRSCGFRGLTWTIGGSLDGTDQTEHRRNLYAMLLWWGDWSYPLRRSATRSNTQTSGNSLPAIVHRTILLSLRASGTKSQEKILIRIHGCF